ncbi:MAG TPA: TMEM43 family protein [Aquimonas sp.]|nr:TMEM43 family protein [Aquimonas sp.]
MSDGSFNTTTRQSWGSRLSQSLGGVLVGGALGIGAVVLLFWNEGRAVDRATTLALGADRVISVSADRVDSANDGELVHVSGTTTISGNLLDPLFGVEQPAIRLQRQVEMYQWVEERESKTREKLGGGTETVTTYRYEKKWSDRLQDSDNFQDASAHRNPKSIPLEQAEWSADSVRLGAFRLNPAQVAELGPTQSLSLAGLSWPGKVVDKPVIARGDHLFLGKTPDEPRVGDLRVRFEWVAPGDVSVVAAQQGDSFTALVTPSGELALLENARVDAQAMFATARHNNTMLTWLLRGVGLLLLFIGWKLVLNPLRTFAAVVPFFARIVDFGTGVVAIALTLVIGLSTIALAWMVARPLLSVALLAGTLALVFGLLRRRGASTNAPTVAAVPPPPPR